MEATILILMWSFGIALVLVPELENPVAGS